MAAVLASASTVAFAQSGGEYDLTQGDFTAGAEVSSGGVFELAGTVDGNGTEPMTGGDFSMNGGFWSAEPPPGCPCTTAADCKNTLCAADNACNCVTCATGACMFTCTVFGNANCSGGVTLDDILCSLAGFANFTACPNGDISPCGGNGILNLDDILAVLNAFGGANPCGCQSAGTPDLCGSNQP